MASIIEIIAKFINEASHGLQQVDRDVDGLGKTSDSTSQSAGGLGESFAGLAGQLGLTLSIAGLATAAFDLLKASIDAYGESELVAAQVNAVLQSTNQIAGVTAEEIEKVADSLSRMSGADDEAIMRGEALLLTFTKIGRDVFPQATEAALNMSMAMGTDLQSSIIQVGKALNDPIEGVSALRRVGVQLTDQQEEQIRQFMAVNDIVGAQTIILGELETQFGGVAEMMGDTTVGAANKLKVAWGNLLETMGGNSAAASRKFNENLADTLIYITDLNKASNDYANTSRRLVDELGLLYVKDEPTGMITMLQRGTLATELYSKQVQAAATSTDELSTSIEVLSEYTPQWDKLLNLTTRVADETERYNEKQTDLQAKQAEVKAKIDELIAQGWSPLSDKVRDLQGDYDALGVKYQENADKHAEAMGRIQYDLLVTKLSVDGLTDAEFEMAQQAGLMFGVFDQESADAARNMDLVAQAVSDGRLEVEDMARALELLPTMKSIDVVINALTNFGGLHEQQFDARGNAWGGGRAAGGPVSAGKMYEVNEGGLPELLSFAGRQFLMMPNAGGYVNALSNGGGGNGGNVVNVYLTVAPQGVTILDETMTADMLKPYVVAAVNEAQAEGLLVSVW